MMNAPNVDPSKVTVITYWGSGFLNTLDVEIFNPVNWPFGPLPRSLAIFAQDESNPKIPWRVIEIYGFPEGRIPKEYVRTLVAGGIYHFGRQEGLCSLSVKESGWSEDSCLLFAECAEGGFFSHQRSQTITPHTAIERTLDAILQVKFPGRSADVTDNFKTIAPMEIPIRKKPADLESSWARYGSDKARYGADIPQAHLRDPVRARWLQSIGEDPDSTEDMVWISSTAPSGSTENSSKYDPR